MNKKLSPSNQRLNSIRQQRLEIEQKANQIKRYCNKNNLTYKLINDVVFVKSEVSQWMIIIEPKHYSLKHYSLDYSRKINHKHKFDYHNHIRTENLAKVLNYIRKHDKKKYFIKNTKRNGDKICQ